MKAESALAPQNAGLRRESRARACGQVAEAGGLASAAVQWTLRRCKVGVRILTFLHVHFGRRRLTASSLTAAAAAAASWTGTAGACRDSSRCRMDGREDRLAFEVPAALSRATVTSSYAIFRARLTCASGTSFLHWRSARLEPDDRGSRQ